MDLKNYHIFEYEGIFGHDLILMHKTKFDKEHFKVIPLGGFMGRVKTLEEKILKRQANSEKNETKMTQKDYKAIHRDKRAIKVMDHLDKIPKNAPNKKG